ncbi:MAG: hypothetical protein ABID04_04230 [Patescibacteria group bacterium]|nr:hypothetical protein [Patescibacteria group bacterium]
MTTGNRKISLRTVRSTSSGQTLMQTQKRIGLRFSLVRDCFFCPTTLTFGFVSDIILLIVWIKIENLLLHSNLIIMSLLKGKTITAQIRDYKTGQLLSTGYNTMPTEDNPLNTIVDFSYIFPEVHAEVNAIRSLSDNLDPQGLILVLNGLPYCCTNCKDYIYKAGIRYVKTPGSGLVAVDSWYQKGQYIEEWKS